MLPNTETDNRCNGVSQGKRVAFDGSGRTVIDTPFAETRVVAGFWLWEVKDMDEAVAWVKRCRQDLDYLEQLMHLDRSFSPADRRRFEQGRAALMQRNTPLSRPQFQLAIDRLVALANNGHTSTLASWRAGRFRRAQVRFACSGMAYISCARNRF
jgi:hypothetical protein